MPCAVCGRWAFAAAIVPIRTNRPCSPGWIAPPRRPRLVGAVNLIFREENALVGENTEGKGVVQTIRGLLDPAGKQVVLLGAGRVARAVAVELAAAGVASITIVNRTEGRAGELVALLAGKFAVPVSAVPWHDDYAVPPETDILDPCHQPRP